MEVKLHNFDEFKRVLVDYEPSEDTKQKLSGIPLVIMLGVSGAGRNTIINHLENSGGYKFVVSDTTRAPKMRDGAMEQHGVQYYFRSEEEILADIHAGNYLEAELIHNQQVSGIRITELEAAAATGKIPINEVDVGGVQAIRQAKPDTVFFFVVPPSYKEWIYRLKGREVMSDEEFTNRMHTAKQVLSHALSNQDMTFVVNDSSFKSAEYIDHIVRSGASRVSDKDARHIATKLLEAL